VAEQVETIAWEAAPARVSLNKTGAILLAASEDAAFDFVNRFAPEHLSLPKASAKTLGRISAAGVGFLQVLSRRSAWRLRERQQPRFAHWRLGAQPRRAVRRQIL